MAKVSKQIRRSVKNISKQINSEKGLMLRHRFDVTTSLYGNGKENKPYMTVNAQGDYKIPVVKLILILACVISAAVLIGLTVKSIADYVRRPVRRRTVKEPTMEE